MGGESASAGSVNNRDQIIGVRRNTDGHSLAFRWDSGTVQTLEPLDGDTDSLAISINDSGDVVGNSFSSAKVRPVLWHNGYPVDLTEFVPSDLRAIYGAATASGINNRGQVLLFMGGKFFGKTIILSPTP